MNVLRLFAAATFAVHLLFCSVTSSVAQNPDYPGYLGVRIVEANGGMRINSFIKDTPAAEASRLGDIERYDVITKLGGKSTRTLRQLLQARNRIPDGMEAKMILRSRRGYVYHIWISRNEAAAAAAALKDGPDVPLQFGKGGRGEGDEDEDFRPKGGAPKGGADDGGDFRPKP